MLTDAITSLVTQYLDPHDLLAWLLTFMVFDILTGIAASFREGRIASSIAWVGIWKKVATALGVLFTVIVDPFVRAYAAGYDPHMSLFAALGFIGVEAFSIVENLGRCGVQTDLLARYLPKAAPKTDPVSTAAGVAATVVATVASTAAAVVAAASTNETTAPIVRKLTDEAVQQIADEIEARMKKESGAA